MTPVPLRTATAHDEVTARLLRDSAAGLPYEAGIGAVAHTTDRSGPVTASMPDERAVQAACGIMHVHGRAAGRPVPLAVDYAATVAGVLGAQGVCAALLARHRGLGLRHVHTSAAQGALFALTQYLAAATADAGEHGDDTGACRNAERGPRTRPERAGPEGATLVTAEGVPVEIETLDPSVWREFWARLRVPATLAGRGWRPFQQRFATAVCALPAQLHGAARTTPLSAVRDAAEAAGMSLLVLDDDPAPPYLPPWQLTPAPDVSAPAPLPPGTRPLEGVRVVEAARRVQGPVTGHALRLLGAEVIRVEPPGGDPMRGLPPLAGGCSARFSALNAGKPVTEADITTAAGRRTVHELAAGADVFLHNWAPGRAERLGLDAAALWRTRPGLVYAAASGFGDAFGAAPPPIGTDYLAQAHSGLAAALRPAGEPPVPSLMTLTDVLGGLVCAQGVLAALLARVHTGRGGRVDSSLFSAAALVPRPPVRARWTPLDLPLRTADGYLSLDEPARGRPEDIAGVTGVTGSDPSATAARFRERTTEEWTAELREAGLTATPVRTDLATLARDPAFRPAVDPGREGGHARPYAPWEFS